MTHYAKRDSRRKLVHFRRFIRHPLRLIGFALSLLSLLALFHLLTIGIPDSVTRQITAQICEKGLPLQIGSIQLSPHRGWVLRDVRIYSTSPDDLQPLFSTEKLYVSLWPDNWQNLSKTGWDVSLFTKNSALSLGWAWETGLPPGSPFGTVDRLHASLHIDSKKIRIDESELLWGGILIHTAGEVVFPAKPSGKTRPDIGLPAAQLANALEQLHFQDEPTLTIRFDIDANAPKKNSADATYFAEGLLWNDHLYQTVSGILHLRNHQLTIESVQLAQPDGTRLTATGSFDLNSRMAEFHLQNTLPADDLLALLPPRIHSDLARLELRFPGSADFDAAFGPARPDQLLETLRINAHNLSAIRKNLALNAVQFDLSLAGNQLKIADVNGLANGGSFGGRIEVDLASKAVQADVEAQCDPAPVGTLRGGGLQKFINRFAFPNEWPKANLAFSYAGTKGSLKIDGTLSGKNFTCGGVPIEALQTSMTYSNKTLTLSTLNATNGNKRFNGSIQIDFRQKLAQFDATTSFEPPEIARVLAPNKPTVLTLFTFAGSVDAMGRGQVDYSGGTNHAFGGTIRAESVSVSMVQADIFKTDINGRGSELLFTNASFQYCDGIVAGSAEFDLNFRDTAAPYHMDIHATDIDFTKFLQSVSTVDHSKTSGKLSGNFDFTADAKDGFWSSAEGAGQVEIAKGNLRNLPILGGFAKLIQGSIPGFSLFSLTTFFADYQLTGGRLRSQNIQLGGTLLSAKARGNYSPDKGLNFNVIAEPLRQTREEKKWYQLHLWGADALKWGTYPLFDLFDFKLEGSLHDPKWRMLALPKEFYEVLRREEL